MERTLCMEGPNQFKEVEYESTCRYGEYDCIWDPAYIYATYPEWYTELYGDKTPEEASKVPGFSCALCKEAALYDDEDK